MRTIAEFLLTVLLNASWQITLMVMFAALCAWILRGTAAWQRHAVWVAALILSFCLPVLSSSKLFVTSFPAEGTEPLPIPAASTKTAQMETAISAHAGESNEFIEPPTPVPQAKPSAATKPFLLEPIRLNGKLAQVLFALYALFMLYRGTQLFQAWRRTTAIVRSAYSRAIPEHVQTIISRCQTMLGVKRFRIVFSAAVPVPITAGVFNPLIILPEQLLREDDQDILASALGHELVHVARRDYILNLLYELIYLPLAFHPAASVLRHRVRQTRELCCDELVAGKLMRAEVYARSLVRLMGSASLAGRLAADTTIGITDADILEVRIMSLLRKSKLSAHRRALLLGAASLLLITPCLAAASFAFSFEIGEREAGAGQQQEAHSQAIEELRRAREELKRKEQELKERARTNPDLQGPEREALRRMEQELQEAAAKLRQGEQGQQRKEAEQRLGEVRQQLAEIEKLYPQNEEHRRELQEKLTQIEKLNPQNEAHLRELQEKLAELEKLQPQNEAARREAEQRLNQLISQNLESRVHTEALEALRRVEQEKQQKEEKLKRKEELKEKTKSAAGEYHAKEAHKLREKEEHKVKTESEGAEHDLRMRKELAESRREERARKQLELTRGANISMDRAIQVATSQYPGKVLACSLGRDEQGRVFYHVVIINSEGEKSAARYVWVSALDGQILKTEKEDR